jgi:DNA-binding MarR family transcriptional regulator
MQTRVTANRLAALATALDDAMFAGVDAFSESAVAALHVIRRAEPIAIQDIAVRIGLTHSATVRLIDRLEKEWLVRRLSRRGREVMVEATARGKRKARELQDLRIAAAEAMLGMLDEDERDVLAGFLDRMLPVPVSGTAAGDHLCRLCDQGVCRGDETCPVEVTGAKMDAAKAQKAAAR